MKNSKFFVQVCEELRLNELCEFYAYFFSILNKFGKCTIGIASLLIAPILLLIFNCLKDEE